MLHILFDCLTNKEIKNEGAFFLGFVSCADQFVNGINQGIDCVRAYQKRIGDDRVQDQFLFHSSS